VGSLEIDEREVLRHSIERDEQDLREAVHELTGAARTQLSLSEFLREAPMVWLFGGFVLGIWLGSRGSRG